MGDSLLVAPVFDDSRAEYYLPAGEWTHALTGEVRAGGGWHFDELDFFGLPLWIRPNRVIPMGPERTQVDYDFVAQVRLVCGKLDRATPCTVPIVDGKGQPVARFELQQEGSRVTVASEDGRSDYEIQLPWASEVDQLEGGRQLATVSERERGPGDPGGVVIQATAGRVSFVYK